jgi:hypothetical protein
MYISQLGRLLRSILVVGFSRVAKIGFLLTYKLKNSIIFIYIYYTRSTGSISFYNSLSVECGNALNIL